MGPRVTRRSSCRPLARSGHWCTVTRAIAASNDWSSSGSFSATPSTAGVRCAGRCARIAADGSIASTWRSMRLVRPGARADVEDRAGVAERGVHPGGQPRVGAALAAIALAVGGVVDVAGDVRVVHGSMRESGIGGAQHDRSSVKRASSASVASSRGAAGDQLRAVGQTQGQEDDLAFARRGQRARHLHAAKQAGAGVQADIGDLAERMRACRRARRRRSSRASRPSASRARPPRRARRRPRNAGARARLRARHRATPNRRIRG